MFSRAKQEKAEIHWGDETGLQTGANRVRGLCTKGGGAGNQDGSRKESCQCDLGHNQRRQGAFYDGRRKL